ncbi:nuclear transport factor 2 family protein [Streptomyces sp. XM4193]|uniref:nuclear transport factor 2 family protein n=1 Tax=Streptomyces sp. XM4193 TaxID=2929782 RepID=UPI001FF71467|nr:nuclear transport factor 2 family protein [Streptomyces sp. XM4193]MCK1798307.1 nuclear transport factor 2 family protein [Streptomyces sp. XM4193]
MSSGPGTDIEAVEAANTGLYEALERGDLEALEERWLDPALDEAQGGEHTADADVSVVHPGWPVLTGRGEVLRSYALIMASTEYIQFFLTDVEISVLGDTALVTCTENILSGGPAEEDGSVGPLVGGLVVATNVFRRAGDGTWKLWAHHGSPVLVDQDDPDESDEESEDGEDTAGGTAFGPA